MDICKTIAVPEEKRAGLLRAEKNRAQASVLQAHPVANAVVRESEVELRNKKERLEDHLQRAPRQQAEFLRQRGGVGVYVTTMVTSFISMEIVFAASLPAPWTLHTEGSPGVHRKPPCALLSRSCH